MSLALTHVLTSKWYGMLKVSAANLVIFVLPLHLAAIEAKVFTSLTKMTIKQNLRIMSYARVIESQNDMNLKCS